MVGNVVYLVVAHYGSEGWPQTETAHATFDGVCKRLEHLEELWKLHKFSTERNSDRLEVRNPDGSMKQYYTVSTKTIQE